MAKCRLACILHYFVYTLHVFGKQSHIYACQAVGLDTKTCLRTAMKVEGASKLWLLSAHRDLYWILYCLNFIGTIPNVIFFRRCMEMQPRKNNGGQLPEP